jgi:hypothetical protein
MMSSLRLAGKVRWWRPHSYLPPILPHSHVATSPGEGTIARIDAAECLRRMTEARARELNGANVPGPDKPGNEDRD